MKCLKCGNENKEGRKFCRQCGASLLGCPKCGFENEPGDTFCGGCGEPLGGGGAAVATAAAPAVAEPAAVKGGDLWGRLEKVVSAGVISNILTEFRQHAGERKNVTIVMADISGYTTMAETLEPEEAREIVNVFFEHWVPIIYKYQAHVHKFVGDQILALFGAPIALEDAPQRALRAGLEMRESLGEINRVINERYPGTVAEPLSAHIGINTGVVVWGEVGPDHTVDVMGDAVNVAARLEHLSQAGEVLVSEETWRLGGSGFEFVAQGEQALGGREQKVALYQLVGLRGITAPRREVELVGREKEMGMLREVLEEAREGKSRAVGVVGEAGMGKSRLVMEFAEQAGGEKATVLQAHCLSYGGNMAYLPFAELTKRYFKIDENDVESTGLRKIEAGLGGLGCPREDVHSVGAMLGYEASRAALQHLRADERRGAISRATERFLGGLAERGAVMVFLDDVHWIDETSRDLLEMLLQQMREKPVMFVFAFRPGLAHSWAELEGYREMTLERLSGDDSERLLERLLERYSLDGRVKRQVLARSQGNPLCMVEIVRSLQEAGGATLSDEALEGLLRKIPGTLWDIIMTRIDALEPSLKEMVRAASVVGREFSKKVLAGVTNLGDEGVVRELRRLAAVEIVRARPETEEEEWEFEHPMAQEVAYENLILGDRRRLHVRVAEVTEMLYTGEARRQKAEILARHYYEGRVPDKAAEYSCLVAERARENFAYPEALTFCARALEMLETLPSSDKARELRIRALRTQGRVWQFQGRAQEARENFTSGLRLAREIGDATLFADAHFNLGHAEFSLGEIEKAKEYFTLALRQWEKLEVNDQVAVSHVGIGSCLYLLGDHEGALRHYEESINLQRELGIPEDPSAVNNAGDIYLSMGDFVRAVESYEKALELSRARGREDKRGEAYASLNLAVALEGQGGHRESVEPAKRALGLADEMGEKFLQSLVNCEMAHFLLHLGRLEEALEHGERALALAEEIGSQEYAGQAKAFLARIWLEVGEEEKALKMVRETGAEAERVGIKRIVALASWVEGEVAGFWGGDWSAARECYDKARLIFQRMKMRKEEAMTALGAAGAEGRLGNPEKAEQEALRALEEFEKMGSKDGMMVGFFTLGQIYEAGERYEPASDYYERSLEMARKIQEPCFECKALLGLSRAAAGRGEEEKSAEYIRLARESAGSILANLRNPQLRERFAATLERRIGLARAVKGSETKQ